MVLDVEKLGIEGGETVKCRQNLQLTIEKHRKQEKRSFFSYLLMTFLALFFQFLFVFLDERKEKRRIGKESTKKKKKKRKEKKKKRKIKEKKRKTETKETKKREKDPT